MNSTKAYYKCELVEYKSEKEVTSKFVKTRCNTSSNSNSNSNSNSKYACDSEDKYNEENEVTSKLTKQTKQTKTLKLKPTKHVT